MSASSENITIKQPLRRFEIQINNFNVAVPHHVDLLKQHKNNIKKYRNQHNWGLLQKEHNNVSRIIKQLKELLYQMETLRAQVLDADIDKFDKLTKNARTSIMRAIEEYLVAEMEMNIPKLSPTLSTSESQNTEYLFSTSHVQLEIEQEEIKHQKRLLRVWNGLQEEIQQLHELFVEFNKVVHDQKEMVDNMEENIEETQTNVNEGTRHLEVASKYKIAAYPLAGAMLGTCIGGPIGLLAGMKIGGLAALSCGILGFTGGSLLKKKQIESQKQEPCANTSAVNLKSVTKSVSCPDNLKEEKKHM